MSETAQQKRLGKVATELNVGITTLMDFLSSKGHEDINRNSKITEEMYAQLLQEFADEKMAKEESKKITQSRSTKKETITIENAHQQQKEVDSDFDSEEILIKDNSGASMQSPIFEKSEAPKVVEPEIKQKEVDKKEDKPTEELKAPEIEKEDDVISAKGKVKLEGPKNTGIKIDLEQLSGKKTKAKVEEKPEPVKEAEPIIEAEKTPEPEKPIEKEPDIEVELEEEIVEETIAAEDIDQPSEESPAETAEEEKDAEPFRKKVNPITGPKVLGTVDLSVFKRPAKAATPSPSHSEKKGKRKRREAPVKPGEQGGGQQGGQKAAAGGQGQKKQGQSRPIQAIQTNVQEEDINKKIKETLSSLQQPKQKSGIKKKLRREARRAELEEQEMNDSENKVIQVTEFVTVSDLAKMMNVQPTQIISTLFSIGLPTSINQRLDAENISLVAEEFGYEVNFVSAEVQEAIKEEEDKPEDLVPRPPIVTVMGHVDHGKTSLLDFIRKANVIAGEAGGITQHIGAYNVTTDKGKKITFLDTPGHEAFTAMRARGAQVTDVVIVVVAADDSVMPQTKEAINHAQAAGVPIVFAINKVDKPNADPNKIKEQLSQLNILVEDWGGKYQSEEISAKQGINVDKLLEKVLLEAEMLDLKANPNKRATGTIIESQLDKGRGYISTLLVQSGTLKIGDVVLAGSYSGKVKALYNERGSGIKSFGPSQAATMLGLNGAPSAGDRFNVMEDEREARDIANKRMQLQREQGIRTTKHITLDEIGRRIALGDFKELNLIVKADVDGSVEALTDSLLKESTEKVQINIIHKSVGQITESDVLLASASNAIVVGFNVRPSVSARKLAESEEIDLRLYSVIYDAVEEIKAAIEGMLAPEYEEKVTCNVEVRDVFKVSKVGTIAGCMVIDGKVTRNTKIRVVRDGIVIKVGELASLKRYKDDVKEVSAGYECGLNIKDFNDIKEGDIIEGYEKVEIKRK
jgi:translation initiation factor IF-2